MKGWKQAYTRNYENLVIVELDIPQDASVKYIKKFGSTKNIYLSNKAIVSSISSFDNKHSVNTARSLRDSKFFYKVGDEVCAKDNRDIGRKPGIYFFKSREEAVKYEY